MASSMSQKNTVRALVIFVTLVSVYVFNGCNVFSPLAADSQKDLNYRGLILKGNEAINNGDYPAARNYFAQAMAMNPAGSEAYLYSSKALVNEYKIDYNSLNKEFDLRRNKDGKGKKGIPFVDSATTIKSIDSIYFPIAQSVENLEHIIRKRTEVIHLESGYSLQPDGDTASDGKVSEGVARLDLGLLEAVKAMLGPLDLDGDNHISAECGKNICPNLADFSCTQSVAYTSKCKEGTASELNRFENFKQLTRSININDLSSDDVRARELSTNPNDINAFLDKMQKPIAGSNFNLDSVTTVMNNHNETKLSGNLSEIVGNIKDLSYFLAYMHYNDGVDNDFDASVTSGQLSPMIWHDYDKDGGIRWDYDDSLTFVGYEGTVLVPQNGESHNIGHPLHRFLHPELYVKFTDPEWTSRSVAKDTSKNSRKALMIKHCKIVAESLAVMGKVDAALKLKLTSQTCSTYTTIIKPNIKPPKRSDWLSGTYGVDEEMIDNRDNDYDGIKDEDGRNIKGLDDDDDALLDVSMIGKNPPPMVWKDVAGHDNKCPDIDTTKVMLPHPLEKQFCIGSLEHRIYLAQHGAPPDTAKSARDSLTAYYSEFIGEGPNKNCLEDFDKLSNEYKTVVGITSSSDPAVRLACHFKHIWIYKGANVRPPHSEWTGGIFGIDEEILDGVDNDGDGWIDEDLK